jgi:hypothetical protein
VRFRAPPTMWELIFAVAGTMQRSSLIKHQNSVNFTTLALSNFDPAATYYWLY